MLTQWIIHLPTWQTIRVLGITAYLLLFFGVCLGMLYSLPRWAGKQKAHLYRFHSSATIAAAFCGVLHAMLLVIDTYMPFSWREVLVPFTAKDEPIWNGLGTITLYGLLSVILTTDLRNKLNRTAWRLLHLLSYPLFIVATVHGIGSGTDTKSLPIFLMYVIACGIVLMLSGARIFSLGNRSNTHPAK